MHSLSMKETYYNCDKEFNNYYKEDNYIFVPVLIDNTPKPKKFALQNIETLMYWTYGKQTKDAQEIFDEETKNNFCAPMGYEWVGIN